MNKFSSPFMAKSPLLKKEPKRVKIESKGMAGQGATEYIRGGRDGDKNARAVEIGKDYGGDQRKTVRRKKKDGSIKTTSKKISDKNAARIKKRKEKNSAPTLNRSAESLKNLKKETQKEFSNSGPTTPKSVKKYNKKIGRLNKKIARKK